MWEAFDSSRIIFRRFRSILVARLLHFLLLTPDAEAHENSPADTR
jgi:hypothetical protein